MFKKLCKAINYQSLSKDKKFLSNALRVKNVIDLKTKLDIEATPINAKHPKSINDAGT